MSRISVYTRDGSYLTDLRVRTTRSWLLSGIGQCDFTIAVNDPKCRRQYLEYGNLLYIQHDSLPDWLGVITPPRSWSGNSLDVRAYEIMALLTHRRTTENLKITGNSGELFRQLVTMGNEAMDTRIRVAEVSGDNAEREETLGSNVYTHIRRIRERSNSDWLVVPNIVSSKLQADVYWQAKINNLAPVRLAEGKNLERGSPMLTEDEPLINDLLGYGDASTTGTRIRSNAINQESIDAYGLWQGEQTFSGTALQTPLDNSTAATVLQTAQPTRAISVVALDVADTFSGLRLGSVYQVELQGAGFTGDTPGYFTTARCCGMRYTDGIGRCEVLTKEEIYAS